MLCITITNRAKASILGVSLFDASTHQGVKLTVDPAFLVQLFRECSYLSTRAAIMQYATLQARNLALMKEVRSYNSLQFHTTAVC